MHMIRAIEAVILNYHVHGMTNIFSLLINIYSVSRVTVVSTTSKDACDKIVQKIFQRLEEYGVDDDKRKTSKAEENINLYLKNISTSLVDEVCIYDARDKPAPLRLVP